MAYDEELASRVRDEIGHPEGLTERRMFGGLAFLISGNMAVGARGDADLAQWVAIGVAYARSLRAKRPPRKAPRWSARDRPVRVPSLAHG